MVTRSTVDAVTGDSEHIPVRIFCSNDYLGMGQNRTVLDAAHQALDDSGMGAGGTRNISGTTHYHVQLEAELADLHKKEKGLVCSSGFVANEAGLQVMGRMLPDCVILSDSDNHASMIDGIRQSKLKKYIFRHNDMAHLEELLQSIPVEQPKMIVFESVYSMTGSQAPLGEIIRLAKLYNALTFVDEVHAVGMYGKTGAGLAEELGLTGEIDIITGTLGKAFGSFGGYIAGSSAYIDCVRSYASSFIFTTALPPVVAAGALSSVRYLKDCGEPTMHEAMASAEANHASHAVAQGEVPHKPTPAEMDGATPSSSSTAPVSSSSRAGTGTVVRQLQRERVTYLKQSLVDTDLPFIDNKSHIVPVFVGDPVKAKQLTDNLLYNHQIYIQPINYPTVPVNSERIRITPGPLHSESDLDDLVNSLNEEWTRLGLPRRSELFAEGRLSRGQEKTKGKPSEEGRLSRGQEKTKGRSVEERMLTPEARGLSSGQEKSEGRWRLKENPGPGS